MNDIRYWRGGVKCCIIEILGKKAIVEFLEDGDDSRGDEFSVAFAGAFERI